MVFVDRQSAHPGRYLVTPETGSSYYATLTRADKPVVAGTPLNAATLNTLVSKSGDTLTGSLTFKNTDSYHALMKYRNVEGQTYGVNVGCGVLGGKGVMCLEARAGSETDSPRLARLEIGELGVSFVNANGKRTYIVESGVIGTTVG